MKLSLVTTMYRSENYLKEFYTRSRQALLQLTEDYEIIFVNDGSPDQSLAVALSLQERDPCITVVDLSRNFGQHKAIMTGLSYAIGDYVFLIDCDLELAPEMLSAFYDKLLAEQADVVFGVQDVRQDPWFNRQLSKLFYQVFNFFSDYPIPANLLIMRLMSQRYVQRLVEHQEQVYIIAGLWAHTGFKQTPLLAEKTYKGTSTYNLRRKIGIALWGVVVFSKKPLLYISYLGTLMMIPSGLYILWIIIATLFLGYGVPGWSSLIVSVWFLGGLTILVLGVIAAYLSVIFMEVKVRPYTIIREIYRPETP